MGDDLNTLNAILYIIFINNIVMWVADSSKLRYHPCQTSGDEVVSASHLKLCCISMSDVGSLYCIICLNNLSFPNFHYCKLMTGFQHGEQDSMRVSMKYEQYRIY